MGDDRFHYLLRVRYGECDAQGVVFNARYGDYIDLASVEFLRAAWGGPREMLAQGLDYQLVRQVKEWTSPARFDDVLAVRVAATRLGTTSFSLAFAFHDHATGRPVMTAETVYVLVDATTHAKTPLPGWLRDALERGAPGVTVDHAGA